jgi:hypothetical protein
VGQRLKVGSARNVLGLVCLFGVQLAYAEEAVPESPQSAVANPAADSEQDELASLRTEIAALESLLRNELPTGTDLFTLFVVDPQDEDAVAPRIKELHTSVLQMEDRLAALRSLPEETAMSKLAASVRVGPAATSSVAQASETAGRLSPSDDVSKEVLTLRIVRDRLRVRFLSQPQPIRLALATAELKRRAIREQAENALLAQRQAEAEGREAEIAREKALADARTAISTAQKALATERARIESLRGRLAELKGSLASTRQTSSADASERLVRYESWLRDLGDPTFSPDKADGMYADVSIALRDSRDHLRTQLDELFRSTAVPSVKADVNLFDAVYDQLPAEKAQLQTALLELRDQAQLIRLDESAERWAEAEAAARDVQALNRLRLKLIPALTEVRRDDLMGLSVAGFQELRQEVDQLGLTGRWYVLSTIHEAKKLPDLAVDVVTVGRASWSVIELLGLVGLCLFVRRRYKRWLFKLRESLSARPKRRWVLRFTRRWISFLLQYGSEAGFFVLAYVVFGFQSATPEGKLLRSMVVGYAWYRLLLALTHHALIHGRSWYQMRVSAIMSDKILATIKLVGRYAFAMYVLLVLSDQVLGGGYLYGLVLGFFWVGSIPIAIILLRRWRPHITSSYLRLYPNGRFSESVRSTEGASMGFFVATMAFAVVAAQAMSNYVRQLFLRFEQTRKALAFLFRRRLEKQAEVRGESVVDLQNLPEAILSAFDENPGHEDLLVGYWPHVAEALEHIHTWEQTGDGVSIAVIGEQGIGKTSWLRHLESKLTSLPVTFLQLDRRLTSRTSVVRYFGEKLDSEGGANEVSLSKRLLSGPRRAIVVDHGERMMIRAVGGTEGYQAFMDLVARTTHHLLWVVSVSRFSWAFLDNRYQGRNLFSQVYRLDGWPEGKIGELVRTRMKASGFDASFEEVVLDQWADGDLEDELERTSERFLRLLWDHSRGNPRIAIHFWKRSLANAGDARLRVRLFAKPKEEGLDDLEEESRFVLAAVMIHQTLTLAEAAKCLAYPANICQAAFAYLKSEGFLVQEGGRYSIPSFMYRAVNKYLIRKNLL